MASDSDNAGADIVALAIRDLTFELGKLTTLAGIAIIGLGAFIERECPADLKQKFVKAVNDFTATR